MNIGYEPIKVVSFKKDVFMFLTACLVYFAADSLLWALISLLSMTFIHYCIDAAIPLFALKFLKRLDEQPELKEKVKKEIRELMGT